MKHKLAIVVLLATILVSGQTTIDFNPMLKQVSSLDASEIQVMVQAVTGLYAVSSSFTYDPAYIRINSIAGGDFLGTEGVHYKLLSKIEADRVTIDLARLVSSGVPSSGSSSGILYKINFSPLKPGTTFLDFQPPVLLRDIDNQPIAAAASERCTIRFSVPVVYVNKDWAGTPFGTDPDAAGPAQKFGIDAYSSFQNAYDAASDGAIYYLNGAEYDHGFAFSKDATVRLLGMGEISCTGDVAVTDDATLTLETNLTVGGDVNATVGDIAVAATATLTMSQTSQLTESSLHQVTGMVRTERMIGTGGSNFGGVGITIGAGSNELGLTQVIRTTGATGNQIPTGINATWQVTCTEIPASARTVSFSWYAPADNGTDLTDLRMFKSNNNGASWNRSSVTGATAAPDGMRSFAPFASFNYAVSEWTVAEVGSWGIAAIGPAQGIAGSVTVNAKVFLQGPFEMDTLRTVLNYSKLLPLRQPYTALSAYPGSENVQTGFFNAFRNVVDWVWIELRTATAANTKIAERTALLTKTGTIIDIDGSNNPVAFTNVPEGEYFVIIRHRNHLGIMSANPIHLSATTPVYDFTTSQSRVFGEIPSMVEVAPGTFAMTAGDYNLDGTVSASDRNTGWVIENGFFGYLNSDFKMDGFVSAGDLNIYWRTNNGKSVQFP